MTRTIVILLLVCGALAGCAGGSPVAPGAERVRTATGISVYHDDDRAVTCWVYAVRDGGGISCLPDSQVRQP